MASVHLPDRLRPAFVVVRAVVGTARDAQLSFLAASLAYYMLVSLFPLALLAFVVAMWVGGEAVATALLDTVGTVLSPTARALLADALRSGEGQTGATLFGVALLLWSGLRVFRGLDIAFSLVYGTTNVDSLPAQLLDAGVALGGITLAIVALALVNAVLAASNLVITGVLGTILLVGALAVAFFPFYYIFPDTALSVREALPGTLVAAVGWTLLGATFALYTASAGAYALYGVVGGILLLLTWFYVGGIVLLVGAVVNAVLADAAATDRQRQGAAAHIAATMTDAGERDAPGDDADESAGPDAHVDPHADGDDADVEALRAEIRDLREELDERSLPREEVEGDLRRYVRARVRRGHARGWGPYLVLLYGTAMTIAALYLLSDWLAIFAMFVIWLSTLGMYVLMLVVGTATGLFGLPGRLLDRLRDRRR